jgi:hypothetical protein
MSGKGLRVQEGKASRTVSTLRKKRNTVFKAKKSLRGGNAGRKKKTRGTPKRKVATLPKINFSGIKKYSSSSASYTEGTGASSSDNKSPSNVKLSTSGTMSTAFAGLTITEGRTDGEAKTSEGEGSGGVHWRESSFGGFEVHTEDEAGNDSAVKSPVAASRAAAEEVFEVHSDVPGIEKTTSPNNLAGTENLFVVHDSVEDDDSNYGESFED